VNIRRENTSARRGEQQLYDEARGPRNPRSLTRRPVPGEWDDPTWLAVAIDDEWMAEQGVRA
jgi:hypothetical protein